MRNSLALLLCGVLMAMSQLASADAPNFMAAIYGDGQVWGTKGNSSLPAPNGKNGQSFDKLYVITNFNDPNAVQLPVSEAAPGNPAYNGGRWDLQLVTWTQAGFLAYGGYAPVLKSGADVISNADAGYLTIASGSTYFQCPLLPVK